MSQSLLRKFLNLTFSCLQVVIVIGLNVERELKQVTVSA